MHARTHARTHIHTYTHTHTCISAHKAHTSCQFTAQKASPTFQHRLRCFPHLSMKPAIPTPPAPFPFLRFHIINLLYCFTQAIITHKHTYTCAQMHAHANTYTSTCTQTQAVIPSSRACTHMHTCAHKTTHMPAIILSNSAYTHVHTCAHISVFLRI